MSKPKKHHFVPKSYLKFFSEENAKGEYYIHVFDKVSGTEFTANIADVAEKNNFNKVEKERFTFTITSDNPVVMLNMKTGDLGFGGNGLDNNMTVIYMSLTPKYLVSMFHKNSLVGHYSQSYENMCIPVDEEIFISNQTFIQLKQASRQVYSKPSQKNIK